MVFVVFSSRAGFYYLCNGEVQFVLYCKYRWPVICSSSVCYIVNSESLSVLKMACHESTRSFLFSLSNQYHFVFSLSAKADKMCDKV